ncbi:uncharacterized protein LOC115408288 isoform X2 [Salarias fasciatus]|uniref:uncharacterized protein LOC115408288 isoform X2 n=1 Tax=Salarias fasciatus TaxID=181472 RepID=UPI00117678AB|nr:uncharacterized protein LOC115408288 isoform X2 [Salarias fasciatus]
MSSIQALREFINERLTAAAGEIFTVFEEAIMHYEEEIERQRSRLLEINWTPPIKLKGTENPQQHTGNQKMISSLEQEEHEAPRIKEEQEDYVAVTVTDGESDNPHNSVRDLTIQRLTAAAVEIFTMYEQTAVQCEEEIDRQRRLLEINWNPQNELHRTATPPRPWTTLEDPAFRHLQDLADKLGASPRSSLMSEEKYNSIIQHLRRPQEKIDPQFKHWVKKRKFQIMDLPGLGLSQVLVLPNDNKNKNDSDSPYLCVLHSGNVVHIVHDIHTHELNHSGYKKVLDYAQRQYFGVFRGLVQEYCNSCQTCQLKQLQAVRPPLWAILQEDFLDHMQSPPVPSPTTHTSIRKRTLDGSHQAATQTADSDNQCKREKAQESEAGDTVSVGVPRLE